MGHEDRVNGCLFFAGGKRVLSYSRDGTAPIWGAKSVAELMVLRGHDAGIIAAAVTSNGRWVVTAGADQSLRLWNARRMRGAVTLRPSRRSGFANDLLFSPDSQRLCAIAHDRVLLWDPYQGSEILSVGSEDEHHDFDRTKVILDDGRLIVRQSRTLD